MTIRTHFARYQTLYALLLIAALARLLFFFDPHEVWWDSGVYVGMAKYLWSFGHAGLGEHIRPVLWPAVLGIAWVMKLNVIWFARVIEFLLALVSTALVFALGRKLFSERTALFSSIVWAFSAIVFSSGFHEYTELPAVTLVLAALVAFVHTRWFLAGLFVGLAFLTKFPAGIFLAVLGIAVLAQKRWKGALWLSAGFTIPAAAYLLFNHMMYGTAFGPLLDARTSILSVLGCNVLRFKPWYQYVIWVFVDNWLNVFAVVGLAAVAARWKRQYVLPVLALIVPVAYLMQLHCREYRYALLFLPILALFTGNGIAFISEWMEKRLKHARTALLLTVVLVSAFHGILFYHGNEIRVLDQNAEHYYRWLEGKEIPGEVWSSNPLVSVYTDQLVHPLYYPVYTEGTATDFNTYLASNKEKIGAVFLDNCGGGIICAPDDAGCAEQLQVLRKLLDADFTQSFSAQSGDCGYAVYVPISST